MIRQLAPMNAASPNLTPVLTLTCLLALLWHGMLHAEEEPWAQPVAVAGSWRLVHPDHPAQPPLTLEVEQAYGRLQGQVSDGRAVSGSVDGHRIRLQLHCSPTASDCREEHYDGLLQGAVISGHSGRGPFTAQIQRAFCLTFDDGPLPGATDAVLAALATLRTSAGTPVRAGFFFVAEAL